MGAGHEARRTGAVVWPLAGGDREVPGLGVLNNTLTPLYHHPDSTRGCIISWPDRIAWFRIILTPVIMALVLADGGFDGAWGWALAVFTVAAVSDFIDGFLARRWEITTTLGAFLDTIADKILVTGTLIALVSVGRAWAWAAFVIIAREMAVMGLRGVAGVQGITVLPSRMGKLKAVAQFIAMGMAMVRTADQWGSLYPDEWMMLIAVALTIASAVDYFVRFTSVVRSS